MGNETFHWDGFMRIIVLPVGRRQFLEENESGLRFRRNKVWGLRNVRPPNNRPSMLWLVDVVLNNVHLSKFPQKNFREIL